MPENVAKSIQGKPCLFTTSLRLLLHGKECQGYDDINQLINTSKSSKVQAHVAFNRSGISIFINYTSESSTTPKSQQNNRLPDTRGEARCVRANTTFNTFGRGISIEYISNTDVTCRAKRGCKKQKSPDRHTVKLQLIILKLSNLMTVDQRQ